MNARSGRGSPVREGGEDATSSNLVPTPQYVTPESLVPVPSPGEGMCFADVLGAARSWDFPVDLLASCQQSPEHHGEGDVLTHTRLVLEALIADREWRMLSAYDRSLLFLTALCHDVAKPACTTVEDGVIRQPGHAHRGEKLVRSILWESWLEPTAREWVSQAIRFHLHPFFLLERQDAGRRCLELAESVQPRLLAILARADANGRVCGTRDDLLDRINLFVEFAQDLGCLDGHFPFSSGHARFTYFQRPGRSPLAIPWEDPDAPEVTMLSGLPASGKDSWVQSELPGVPVVSLDALRKQLRIPPTKPQGLVAAAAKELARSYLRQQIPFVWNATNLSRNRRMAVLRLLDSYDARVHIVHLEVSAEDQRRLNAARSAPVPDHVLRHMLLSWEVPTTAECGRLSSILT